MDQLALGGDHSCALTQGEVQCWGNGWSVGNNQPDNIAQWTPTSVLTDVDNSLTGVQEIAAFSHTTCALAAGTVWCWDPNRGFATNLPW